jgi:hypothetical protein
MPNFKPRLRQQQSKSKVVLMCHTCHRDGSAGTCDACLVAGITEDAQLWATAALQAVEHITPKDMQGLENHVMCADSSCYASTTADA